MRLPSSMLLTFCLATLTLSAAEKPWSAWTGAVGDDAIQFRWQLETFGALAPNCNIEVRNNFMKVGEVKATIQVVRSSNNESIHRTFYLDSGYQKASDVITDCKSISEFTVVQRHRK
jgi:hypothetical protein